MFIGAIPSIAFIKIIKIFKWLLADGAVICVEWIKNHDLLLQIQRQSLETIDSLLRLIKIYFEKIIYFEQMCPSAARD
jgi:hypothetical protein